jgi:hypothetical protein
MIKITNMNRGQVAGKPPQMDQLEDGKTDAWYNGAHMGSEFTPTVFQAEEAKTAALGKQTKNSPCCDGSHMSL